MSITVLGTRVPGRGRSRGRSVHNVVNLNWVKSVNVKTARSGLRRLLEDVRSGEEVVILKRGKQVARLLPPDGPRRLPSLREFRSSIRVRGGPVSAQVIAERRQRY